MNKEENVCYRCGQRATTREHVPARCFFPETKDLAQGSFRSNLITVPSCELHNGKKSKDDEFVMACIASIIGNNYLGYLHTQTKVKRIFSRRGDDFIHTLQRNSKEFVLRVNGHNYPVSLGNPHVDRLFECFTSIAYGLFYYEFKLVFRGECYLFPLFLNSDNHYFNKRKALISKRWEFEPKEAERGSNPLVFKYQFGKIDNYGLTTMKMTFYEGAEVFVCFCPDGVAKPFDFIGKSLEYGFYTTVKFPDGSSFLFDPKEKA